MTPLLLGVVGLPTTRGAPACAALAIAVASCASPPADVVPIEIRIGAADGRCRPTSVRATRVSVLGDFAPEPTDTVELLVSAGARELLGLRPALRAIRAEVDGEPSYRAIGGASFEDVRASGAIAVLPPLLSCALLDPDAYVPIDGALAAHPDGTAWIVGGRDDARRIARIDPRRAFAEVRPDALFNRREGASATVIDREVLIAGGAPGALDTAHDSYERLDESIESAAGELGGRLSTPRRDHAAVALGEDRVVLIGGRSGGAADALVARIEIIDVVAGGARLGPALSAPRIDPVAWVMEDGSIAVAGGRTLEGEPVTTLERIEADLDRVRALDLALPRPDRVIGLPLDRMLHVSGTEVRVIDLRAEPPRAELAARRTEIVAPRGVATASGRVVLAGTSASGASIVELWTPHLGTMQPLEAGRDPRALLSLAGSVVLEVGGGGASVRALDEPGTWSSLPNDRLLFPSDLSSPFVIATLPGDLDARRATRAGTRIAVAALRLGALSIGVSATGAHTLVLRDGTRAIEIAFDAEGNAFGPGCSLAHAAAPILVTRAGASLELVREAERARCDELEPTALLSVELELDRDTELRELFVSRRAR